LTQRKDRGAAARHDGAMIGRDPRAAGVPLWRRRHRLPDEMLAFAWRATARHQLALIALAVAVFLMTAAPLELQRRIVNQVLARGDGAAAAFEAVLLLVGAYVAVALVAGLTKLGFNVYRNWVGETAVRILRATVYDRAALHHARLPHDTAEEGISLAVVLAEVEPVGGFVGTILSEPLLQGGILASVFGYMLFLQPWIALLAFVLFLPQLVFIPAMQHAINRRAERRIRTLREVGTQLVDDWSVETAGWRKPHYLDQIGRVFAVNMQIFGLKFSLNFLMNLLHHLGIAVVLLVGGWYVLEQRIDLGTIVAFLSGLASVKDPWGDLVDYYRELSMARVKYGLIVRVFGDGRLPAAVGVADAGAASMSGTGA
jgi:ABC-type multidrug transport system fused ATPase/permease subunit